MEEQNHDELKSLVLGFMKIMFEEMEEEMVTSHQEKYALLENAFENATDPGELKIAFEQWYIDHTEELDFEHKVDELWDQAINPEDE